MSARNAAFAAAGLVVGLALAWAFGPRTGAAQLRTRVGVGDVAITSTPQGVFVSDGSRIWECDPRPGTENGPAAPSCSRPTHLDR